MTSKERVLSRERERGRLDSADRQTRAPDMDGTALYSEDSKIPQFKAVVTKTNMLDRPLGFVCKSSAGRVVKLLQPYDSTIYTQEPEELPAQWGFVWSDNPAHALAFVSIATSPYMKGDCCTDNGATWRSLIDNNVFVPSEYPKAWEQL